MRLPPALAVSALLLISCGSLQQEPAEELPELPEATEATAGMFTSADSLALLGMMDPAADSLVKLLDLHPELRDEILWRLLGLYHGMAMEDEFVRLADSLEMGGMGPLTGWKASALDLAGRPEEALLYVADSDPWLSAWLARDDSSRTVPEPPEVMFPGAALALAHTAQPGNLSPGGLAGLAEYAPLFPEVGSAILRHLRAAGDTSGTWRMNILASMEPGPGRDLLLAELRAEADSGSLRYWLELLETSGPAAAVAAGELLERFSGRFSPSWRAADRLAETGETALALEYSIAGDHWHRTGTEMAVLLSQKRYDLLLELTDGASAGWPDSLRARAALFRAHALRGAGRPAAVCHRAYLEFARSFPGHPQAREAAYNAGKYHDCEQQWSSGAEAYLVSLRASGAWEGDERGHWRGGFCLYMAGRYREADSLWTAGCLKWPKGYWRDEMLFWRARLAGELGDPHLRDSLLERVSMEHPWEFYGMLAARRLGLGTFPDLAVPDIRLSRDPVCSLAVFLTGEGYGLPAAEMLLTFSGSPVENRAAALSLMGYHGYSLSLLRGLDSRLREVEGRMLPDSLLLLYFPSPYRGLAASATDTLLLEADILQGIMREESYFNRWVVSHAGARGVVQLMPSTAADVARWYGLPQLSEEGFFDPSASVPYGALYIDRQYRSFDGESPLFLAAYNAGPANASRWSGMHGWNPRDPEMYIEQITYRETRMYVKKVLRSAWIYERR